MKIIECPRDAMQGLHDFIPTDLKFRYISALLKVGFDTLDFGSFVSPKVIPQMQDTAEIIEKIGSKNKTSLLAIVANLRGTEDALKFEMIDYLGYPLSVSETFQQNNTNRTINNALDLVDQINTLCSAKNRKLVVYISMAFGNPFGDPWDPDIVIEFAHKLVRMGIEIISVADTVGSAKPKTIEYLFSRLIPTFPETEIGVHFHTQPNRWQQKLESAYENGCRRYDGALLGYGGCPMANDQLVGNMPTEKILEFLAVKKEKLTINKEAYREAVILAKEIFGRYN